VIKLELININHYVSLINNSPPKQAIGETDDVQTKSDDETIENFDDVTVNIKESVETACICCEGNEPNQPVLYDYEGTKKQCGKQVRKFDSSWYKTWTWLHLKKSNVVLCFLCSWMERAKCGIMVERFVNLRSLLR